MKKLIILIILTIFLSGCWSSKEVTDLSIAMGLGIDKDEEGYSVTVQLINPSDISTQIPSTRTGVTIYKSTGKTIFETLRKLTKKSPRKIYLSHLQTIVFGEDFAKEGISNALDFFSRDHELRTDFYMLVAKDSKAEDVLKVLTPLEKIPALNMYKSLEMSEKAWAETYHVELDDLISTLLSDGKNPVLTGINLTGDLSRGTSKENVERIQSLATTSIDNIAVFKEDKLVGWLSSDESKGYNYIDDNINSTIINVPCSKEEVISVEIIRSKTKVKGSVEEGKPQIDIEVKSEANIGSVECDIKLLETENVYNLEKKVEQKIKEQMEKVLKVAQKKYKSDIFGFGEAIHREDPKAWKELKKDWNEKFSNMSVNIDVDLKLRRLGTVNESFQSKAKE